MSQSYSHLKSWVLEASNDGDNWEEVDRQINIQSLNGLKYHDAFDITSLPDKFVQFIRLQHIDQNHSAGHHLIFNSIEFYCDLKFKA
ncbi:hypothetical protein TRFO_01064 [Tritrichomonas foetus]|uniref:F5/8 type C domain-containing protein n=1 Tax=Tritrichomonas foetus TaxID=1144522 RepID=A0A1J4KIV2_9EUKA|nr:hypothetical protein TRFO_01064 [Tritrichomonas foetus]|eukprot:OHT11163.1 hypothetical protein TRFO_01064 [Tritrichomonas foetus]